MPNLTTTFSRLQLFDPSLILVLFNTEIHALVGSSGSHPQLAYHAVLVELISGGVKCGGCPSMSAEQLSILRPHWVLHVT